MVRSIEASVILVILAGCGGGMNTKPDPGPEPSAAKKRTGPEPEHILVAHVLIAFQGTGTKATRTRAAAEKLAQEVFGRARKGEDFNKLIRDLSDDEGDGVYGLANHHISPVGNEYERGKMVAAFGDVGFQLDVGEVGISSYDPKTSPYGWHIIKRLK